MDDIRMASAVLAALELLPAEDWDLTPLLRRAAERAAFAHALGLSDQPVPEVQSDLLTYLADNRDSGRLAHWLKVLQEGIDARQFAPLLAGTNAYPAALEDIWDAPPLLFRSVPRSGDVSSLEPVGPTGRGVSIVGGRETATSVLEATTEVAAALAVGGTTVVSGLAAGVDTAAHEGALSVGGLTVAVLGTGILRVFPEANRGLAEVIRERGVLLSQFAPTAPRTGTTFLRRNAVIAALSEVSLIMDGRARSGSRHEIEQAIRYGKSVLMWRPALAAETWAQDLADVGRAIFVESVEEVLAFCQGADHASRTAQPAGDASHVRPHRRGLGSAAAAIGGRLRRMSDVDASRWAGARRAVRELS